MQNEDVFAGIGSICSGILAFFSWLWSIPILQFAFTFILGTLVTYFIQSKLQDRIEKRKITRKNIEKIYGPLYVQLQEYRKSVVEELAVPRFEIGRFGYTSEPYWAKVKTFPEFFSIPVRLREQMDEVVENGSSIVSRLDEVKRIADSCLIDAAESVLKAKLEENDQLLSRDSYPPTFSISANSSTGTFYSVYFLHDYLLLEQNPFERIKGKFPDFSPERSNLRIAVKQRKIVTSQVRIEEFSLHQMKNELQQILQEARARAKEDKAVAKLRKKRKELSQGIDKLLPTLEKYIKKHYPIEDI